MKLKNKYALITGASEGLGKAICQAYLAEGASVMICARSEEKLRATHRELSKNLRLKEILKLGLLPETFTIKVCLLLTSVFLQIQIHWR